MNDRDRDFSRQQLVFPHERRRRTCIVEAGALFACRNASTFIKMGAAAAGVEEIWSDYDGPQGSSASWLTGEHYKLVKVIGGDRTVLDYMTRRQSRKI